METELDEVLGVYVTPTAGYKNHAQYLGAAFAAKENKENRVRANQFHALATGELGSYWGTLLALGAYSLGESLEKALREGSHEELYPGNREALRRGQESWDWV
jgi:hypothetical protein